MNKKISLGLTLALIFLSITATAAITMSLSMRTYNSLIKDLPNRTQMYSFLSEIDDVVRTNYYGEINKNLLNSDLSQGYTKGLGDRFSYYMTAKEFETYQNEMNGQKIGIGIISAFNTEDTAIYVAEVSENSPAHLSGLQKGDKITAIDNEKVTAYNYEALTKKLTGEKLSTVAITYQRDNIEATVNVVKGYTAQTVYHSLNGTVGYIKITDFYSTTASQLDNAVKALTKQGAASLIFDVRNNASGSIENAAKAIDVLVPVASEGTKAIATAVDKAGKPIETFTSDADSVNVPMAVLINGNTSGAAELFSCDLRDFGKARLIGEKTAGNGTMQQAFRLSDGSAIMLTVAEIKPYTSASYNTVGLNPNEEVVLTKEQNNKLALLPLADDAQYQKANTVLSGNNNNG
ncbi:MAG: S41 family peptidase [Oscillospiraceae bacterium]